MKNVEEFLTGVRTMGIAGHIRPDGDAVGSAMALYLYVLTYHPEITADVYLDHPRPVFGHILHIDKIKTSYEAPDTAYDLFVTCDVSTLERVSAGQEVFGRAGKTVCIDHHVSNTRFADINHVEGDVGSCCEVLYGLMDEEKITLSIAEALYTGMLHDTGGFQYPSTTPRTLRIAAKLMEKGVNFPEIIEHSFLTRSYLQNQVMGRVLAESVMLMDGKLIVGYMRKRDMDFYGVTGKDLEGIVGHLCHTTGVEASMLLYETEFQVFRVSLRSAGRVDVNEAAGYFGGGGHKAAAGLELAGSLHDVVNNVAAQIALQLEKLGIYPAKETS